MFDVGLMSCGETSRKPIQQLNVSVGNVAGLCFNMSLLITFHHFWIVPLGFSYAKLS